MYQAKTGIHELPTGKGPDINIILHSNKYIERCSLNQTKQAKTYSLFTLEFYPVQTCFSV